MKLFALTIALCTTVEIKCTESTLKKEWIVKDWVKFMEESPTRPPSQQCSPALIRRDIEAPNPKYIEMNNPHRPTLKQLEGIVKTLQPYKPLIMRDLKDLLKYMHLLHKAHPYIILSQTCSIQQTFKDAKQLGLEYKQIIKIPIYHINTDKYKELLEMQLILNFLNETNMNLASNLASTNSRYRSIIITAFNRFQYSTDIYVKMRNLVESLAYTIILDKTINLIQ